MAAAATRRRRGSRCTSAPSADGMFKEIIGQTPSPVIASLWPSVARARSANTPDSIRRAKGMRRRVRPGNSIPELCAHRGLPAMVETVRDGRGDRAVFTDSPTWTGMK
jgi:hypothetical protein